MPQFTFIELFSFLNQLYHAIQKFLIKANMIVVTMAPASGYHILFISITRRTGLAASTAVFSSTYATHISNGNNVSKSSPSGNNNNSGGNNNGKANASRLQSK